MRRLITLALLALLALPAVLSGSPSSARAATPAATPRASSAAVDPEIDADLSDHVIGITTGFTGSNLLLFGAREGEGDVVMVVSGPASNLAIRRKDRRMGIWLNADSLTFRDVPSFYAVLSSRPLNEILTPEQAQNFGIGFDALCPEPLTPGESAEAIAGFQQALFRLKKEQGLYYQEDSVRFQGPRLFRANLHVPATVPVGEFRVTVYLVKNGQVVSAHDTPLVVAKEGVGAQVHYFANEYAAAYGALAIIVSVMAGWVAGIIFRKV